MINLNEIMTSRNEPYIAEIKHTFTFWFFGRRVLVFTLTSGFKNKVKDGK